jgi:hypothetical protein
VDIVTQKFLYARGEFRVLKSVRQKNNSELETVNWKSDSLVKMQGKKLFAEFVFSFDIGE